ncbi:BolA/IbaG family iron-sulfur metabolism protein [Avibacterium sp. 21-586]|uniref:BolA family protein n=1 Tax=Avibacterium sp. 21-586 TaxID=2911534 RepID=UPI00224857D3|nr:BolA/IbaG family iron-sulfur metabolism protein [Avibacterium sp. 21-586]MCW9710785.1 BolA/IbaG family iron-sulfur metabolism protein [Avibacterium sp. 21-586]
MAVQQILEQKISQKFAPHFLHIENESHMHSSGRGADSHFKVVLVSDEFNGVRKVARHQMLYKLLGEELKNGIHALALHTYTLDEWQALEQQFPKSPNCLGVGQ